MDKSKIKEVFSSKIVLFIIILLFLRGICYIPYGVYYITAQVMGNDFGYHWLVGFFNFVMAGEKIVPAAALTMIYAGCKGEMKDKQYQTGLFILKVIMTAVSVVWVLMSVIGMNFLNGLTQFVNSLLIFLLFPLLLFNTLKFIYGKWLKILLMSSMGMFVCDVLFTGVLFGEMIILHVIPYLFSAVIDLLIFIAAWKYYKIKGY